jgi:hypothetical protein
VLLLVFFCVWAQGVCVHFRLSFRVVWGLQPRPVAPPVFHLCELVAVCVRSFCPCCVHVRVWLASDFLCARSHAWLTRRPAAPSVYLLWLLVVDTGTPPLSVAFNITITVRPQRRSHVCPLDPPVCTRLLGAAARDGCLWWWWGGGRESLASDRPFVRW